MRGVYCVATLRCVVCEEGGSNGERGEDLQRRFLLLLPVLVLASGAAHGQAWWRTGPKSAAVQSGGCPTPAPEWGLLRQTACAWCVYVCVSVCAYEYVFETMYACPDILVYN